MSNDLKFVIPLPPPNLTANLHVGHALAIAVEDCLARYHRMTGKEVLYLPGTDHGGISTQFVVEGLLWKYEGDESLAI